MVNFKFGIPNCNNKGIALIEILSLIQFLIEEFCMRLYLLVNWF